MADYIQMLALSPTMETGTIQKWLVEENKKFSTGDILCEVETDKATMEYEAIEEGVLLKILVGVGGQAAVGDPIAIFGESGEDISELVAGFEKGGSGGSKPKTEESSTPQQVTEPEPVVTEQADTPVQHTSGGRVKSSPLARKLAALNGVDISMVNGTGPGGRIVKRDIETFLATGGTVTQQAQGQVPGSSLPPAQVFAQATLPPGDVTIPVSQKRAIIAKRLGESKFSAPHYYIRVSIPMDGMMEARTRINTSLRDEKISVNAFLIKLCAEAIKRNPVINSTWKGDTILQNGSVDIGLAVAQDDGLITPVVRNCGNKGIRQIHAELQDLIARARANKLKPEEFTGATFTISSLGSFGVDEFTAIINPPGSAILAVGAINKVPVVRDDDSITIEKQMKVTLSCDHRVIDGAQGALFLKTLKDMFIDPFSALL
jgi:pyruvate dehydrogenase E2 component (dihydrolipoamide acetyltransferase)